jgi:hypothetical protein
MKRLLECSVLLRMYTMLMSLLYCYTSFNHPEMIMYQVAHANTFASLMMLVMGVLAVVGMVDILINDLMPDRFIFLQALKTRHLVLMGIPICFAVQISTCIEAGMSYAVLPFYLIYTVLVPLSAFVDVHKRHLKAVCQ